MNVSTINPYDLLCVKALFLARQYRRCAQTCHGLLVAAIPTCTKHEVHIAFLTFYQAMSYDELARLMHDNSHTKLPAMQEAEDLYLATLRIMPTLCVPRSPNSQPLSSTLREPPTTHPGTGIEMESTEVGTSDTLGSNVQESMGACDDPFAPTLEQVTLADVQLIPSPRSKLPRLRAVVLPREHSHLSLVDAGSIQDAPRSATQTLLKPVRLGSPPKPYLAHAPIVCQSPQSTRLPVPIESPTPQRRSYVRTRPEVILELPPPFKIGLPHLHDDSTSLDLPEVHSEPHTSHEIVSDPSSTPYDQHQDRLAEHLAAMRIQIRTHLSQLSFLREKVLQSQQRRHKRPTSSQNCRPLPAAEHRHKTGKAGMPKERSFWSFTPDDVRAANLQERIVCGRQRGWSRPRWNPDRYRVLADLALSEQ